ncbi:MAG: TonB-dependent receptor [Bacteroidales bacterium]|nr:TonB-dependent receptor [Bacteroidales bacterium]
MTKTRLFFLLSLLCLSAGVYAQSFTGTVYYQDTKGNRDVLPFAQVYYLEHKSLLDCDEHGSFSLDLDHDATFVATYVGYSQDTVRVVAGTPSAEFCLTGSNELQEAVATARQAGLQRLSQIKTEAITAAGLCKMACCNLAESFENTASVSVGYSDAVTGARQIKLLGLSGVYTQMQDEKMPVMKGLASTFGLNYIPGQWLESILIAKGPGSVANDAGGITGIINMEHRKPLDETPLFVNVYGSSDKMFDANVVSALQLNDCWSTVLLTYFSYANSMMDHNGDGFRDDPTTRQINVANRWLYYAPSGLQVRFGFKVVDDDREGGQMGFNRKMAGEMTPAAWGSLIKNRLYNGYMKIGLPLADDQSSSIAFVTTYNHYTSQATFGCNPYDGIQDNLFANLIYHNDFNESHTLEVALTSQWDRTDEEYTRWEYGGGIYTPFPIPVRSEIQAGAMAEYTYKVGEIFTAVAGMRVDYDTYYKKWLPAPRLTVKYAPIHDLVLRGSVGRAFHAPSVFADNYGLFSSNREFMYSPAPDGKGGYAEERGLNLDMEDAVTAGANITWYLPIGEEDASFLSFEAFHTQFAHQVYADIEYKPNTTAVYLTQSATNTLQADLSLDFNEHFNALVTFRYTDPQVVVKRAYSDVTETIQRPMTSRYKGVLNLQYKTDLSKWIFDFTAQLNGPMRLPNYAADIWGMEYSPVYPMLYAQVTRKFKGLDIYAGAENITGFRQHDAILGAEDPFGADFDASVVWGPLMGRKFYLGLRYTLWK